MAKKRSFKPNWLLIGGGLAAAYYVWKSQAAKSVSGIFGLSSIEKKVNEVNDLINKANLFNLTVIDTNGTWQTPMKYKPFRYSNSVLYEEYQELDLYGYAKKGYRDWILKKNKYTKTGDGIDVQKSVLNDVAKMYRKALKHYDKYGY